MNHESRDFDHPNSGRDPYAAPRVIDPLDQVQLVYTFAGLLKASIVFAMVAPIAAAVVMLVGGMLLFICLELVLFVFGSLLQFWFADWNSQLFYPVVWGVAISVSVIVGVVVGLRSARDTLPCQVRDDLGEEDPRVSLQ